MGRSGGSGLGGGGESRGRIGGIKSWEGQDGGRWGGGRMDGGRAYRLTFTWGRTFILVPDAPPPPPPGAPGKQACHLLSGRRIYQTPPNTQSFPHTAHHILFRVFALLGPAAGSARQTTGIYCPTSGVRIHNHMCVFADK